VHAAENERGLTPPELAVKMDNDPTAEIIASKLPPEHRRRPKKRAPNSSCFSHTFSPWSRAVAIYIYSYH
jgi:hypothetical protein